MHSPVQSITSFAENATTGTGSMVTVSACEKVFEPMALLTVSVTVYVPEVVKQNAAGVGPV